MYKVGFIALLGALVVSILTCCAAVQKPITLGDVEPVFWKLCYDKDGSPEYPSSSFPYDNENCDETTEITWPTLPIKIAFSEQYASNEDWIAKRAVQVWNSWADAKLFQVVLESEPHDVFIQYGDPDLGEYMGIAAQALHKRDLKTGKVFFNIYIYDSAVGESDTVVHELGHVLGLQHDVDKRSIMRTGRTDRVVPWLSAKDAHALRMKYGLPFTRNYP